MSVNGIVVYVGGTCIQNRFLYIPIFQEYATYRLCSDLGFFATLHILFIVNMQILSNSLHKPCTVSCPMAASAPLHAKVWCISKHRICKLSSCLCKVRHNARTVVCRRASSLGNTEACSREPCPSPACRILTPQAEKRTTRLIVRAKQQHLREPRHAPRTGPRTDTVISMRS